MKRKPPTAGQFAVDRAAILSKIPGVRLSEEDKQFGRGRPRLIAATKLDPESGDATQRSGRAGRRG